MPTVFRVGSARFFFYSNENQEPPHVHVARAGRIAKFWLAPVSLAKSSRFRVHELRHLEQLVAEHRGVLLKAWYDRFRT
jgi:hypothetical protein